MSEEENKVESLSSSEIITNNNPISKKSQEVFKFDHANVYGAFSTNYNSYALGTHQNLPNGLPKSEGSYLLDARSSPLLHQSSPSLSTMSDKAFCSPDRRLSHSSSDTNLSDHVHVDGKQQPLKSLIMPTCEAPLLLSTEVMNNMQKPKLLSNDIAYGKTEQKILSSSASCPAFNKLVSLPDYPGHNASNIYFVNTNVAKQEPPETRMLNKHSVSSTLQHATDSVNSHINETAMRVSPNLFNFSKPYTSLYQQHTTNLSNNPEHLVSNINANEKNVEVAISSSLPLQPISFPRKVAQSCANPNVSNAPLPNASKLFCPLQTNQGSQSCITNPQSVSSYSYALPAAASSTSVNAIMTPTFHSQNYASKNSLNPSLFSGGINATVTPNSASNFNTLSSNIPVSSSGFSNQFSGRHSSSNSPSTIKSEGIARSTHIVSSGPTIPAIYSVASSGSILQKTDNTQFNSMPNKFSNFNSAPSAGVPVASNISSNFPVYSTVQTNTGMSRQTSAYNMPVISSAGHIPTKDTEIPRPLNFTTPRIPPPLRPPVAGRMQPSSDTLHGSVFTSKPSIISPMQPNLNSLTESFPISGCQLTGYSHPKSSTSAGSLPLSSHNIAHSHPNASTGTISAVHPDAARYAPPFAVPVTSSVPALKPPLPVGNNISSATVLQHTSAGGQEHIGSLSNASSSSVSSQTSLLAEHNKENKYQYAGSAKYPLQQSNRYPSQSVCTQSSGISESGPPMNSLSQQLGGLSVTHGGWNQSWGIQHIDLLLQRNILPAGGVEPPKPVLIQDYLPHCSPHVFRCTLTKIPETKNVLQKARLPFGILIHPFKDLEHLPVVTCNAIVRCRACRTYINPYIIFKGDRHWECNLCFRVNELPDEFHYDPVSKTYGDPSRRPEVREATIEFIAPQEYMLRPPQPACYLYIFDVTRQAVETGYLKLVCDTLLKELDKIPGDRRALIGFITVSATIQFYLMREGQNYVQMLEVGDVDDIFVPCPEDLLVNLGESKLLVEELLTTLPDSHASNTSTQSALGAALTVAHKLMGPVGGRVTVMAATLPTLGPGALKQREDPNQRASEDISNLGPATDFYKKLALDCSGQQIAVDLFTFNSQYIDLATLSGISKFSGGCLHHFPGFHAARNPASVSPFVSCFTRYITRKVGFEAVMRIRATRGLAITNFHGNFFVRSTDLLSLPNINPDCGFGMQVNIEEPLHNIRTACFQAALLYTSSRGERRIRVHTLCLPVSPNIHEVVISCDQQAVVALLSKMAVDRCLISQMSDARDALVNACVDALTSYRNHLSSPSVGSLEAPHTLALLPLYSIALLKSVAFRYGLSTKLDDRVFAMCDLKTLPLSSVIKTIYPDLYPIHELSEKGAISLDDMVIPQPPRLHLSSEKLNRNGAYLLDCGSTIYVYIRSSVAPQWIEAVLGVASFAAIPQPLYDDPFPCLENELSQLLRNFLAHLQKLKPYFVPVLVMKEDNPARQLFIQHLVDDRTEGAHSYVEFLQFVKSQVK